MLLRGREPHQRLAGAALGASSAPDQRDRCRSGLGRQDVDRAVALAQQRPQCAAQRRHQPAQGRRPGSGIPAGRRCDAARRPGSRADLAALLRRGEFGAAAGRARHEDGIRDAPAAPGRAGATPGAPDRSSRRDTAAPPNAAACSRRRSRNAGRPERSGPATRVRISISVAARSSPAAGSSRARTRSPGKAKRHEHALALPVGDGVALPAHGGRAPVRPGREVGVGSAHAGSVRLLLGSPRQGQWAAL